MSYFWPQPFSTSPPTKADLDLNAKLRTVLEAHDFFESDEESAKREIVLAKLDAIVKEWVCKVSLRKNFAESVANEAGGKIFTLGSYRLGVHQKGADIDTVVLGPKHVDRDDFFNELYEMLLQRPEVTKLTPVPDAHTPIMKMVFSNIEIDLLQATIQRSSIPEDINLNDISILQNMDEKSMRALNGPRVADELLRLVPNIGTYRLALCAIKLWAQRRAIYSNIMGFLGGIAWALMVARICQLYPNACSSTIVMKFFRVYRDWKWPNPVCLKPLEDGPLGFRVWNPRINTNDKLHLMPVITPAYPSMNSTYNVSRSTFETMKDEISRGSEITQQIEQGLATWDMLFEKSDFFYKVKNYLEVTVSGGSEEELASWCGYVESRIRHLIVALERMPQVRRAAPYPDTFSLPVQKIETETPTIADGSTTDNNSTERHSSTFFLALMTQKSRPDDPVAQRTLDLTDSVEQFMFTLQETLGSMRRTDSMKVEIRHLKQSQLPSYAIEAGGKRKPPTKAASPMKASAGPAQTVCPTVIGSTGSKKRKADETIDDGLTPEMVSVKRPADETAKPQVEVTATQSPKSVPATGDDVPPVTTTTAPAPVQDAQVAELDSSSLFRTPMDATGPTTVRRLDIKLNLVASPTTNQT